MVIARPPAQKCHCEAEGRGNLSGAAPKNVIAKRPFYSVCEEPAGDAAISSSVEAFLQVRPLLGGFSNPLLQMLPYHILHGFTQFLDGIGFDQLFVEPIFPVFSHDRVIDVTAGNNGLYRGIQLE
jgi:hypothetical protein